MQTGVVDAVRSSFKCYSTKRSLLFSRTYFWQMKSSG